MVGGQKRTCHTGLPPVSMAELRRMHAMKTGALLRPSCAARRRPELRTMCERIGRYGAALSGQIADDILTSFLTRPPWACLPAAMMNRGKNTYPALVGLDESRRLAREQRMPPAPRWPLLAAVPEADPARLLIHHHESGPEK